MKLIKVKEGLLEAENFFLVSPFNDFAGDTNVTRDISTGKLSIVSNNKIERKFNFDEFVIEVEKENFDSFNPNDYCMVYLGDDNCSFGIKEDNSTTQNKYWKILRMDNYVQAYSSSDGVNYENVGGMEFVDTLTKQGFMKFNDRPLILDSYKLYSNPYITVQNFPQDTLCELYDTLGNLIKSRTFDSEMECKLYLDSNNFQGYLVFKDFEGNELYTTDNITMCYGDVWVFSPYNFEILYLGSIVTNTSPATLQDLNEVIVIKNVGDTDYTNIVIGTQTASVDLIQVSLDGITYTDTITLDIAQNEEKSLYVKITKNVDSHDFKIRDFQVVING